MAKATIPAAPPIILLELTQEEAQRLRIVLGRIGYAGVMGPTKVAISNIFCELEPFTEYTDRNPFNRLVELKSGE